MLHTGKIQVIAWAVRQKDGNQAAGCELFVITVESQKSLDVKDVQLLQVTVTKACEGLLLFDLLLPTAL